MITIQRIVFLALFFSIFSGVFVAAPNVAHAITSAELQAQIDQLRAQIAQLQQQLAEQQGEPAAFCYNFNTNLTIGSTDTADIKALHTILEKEGVSVGTDIDDSATGAFTEKTASAVVGFQQKYKEEILGPYGLQFGTGFVGTTTRAKLNALYGCNVAQPPVLSPGPTTPLPAPTPLPIPAPAPIAGISSLTVVSPNGPQQKGGPEQWVTGQTHTITWKSQGVVIFTLDLICKGAACVSPFRNIASQVRASQGSYAWKVPADIPAGEYKIRAYVPTASGGISDVGDESDGYFDIAVSSPCGSFGDVNGDGAVTKADSNLILGHIVGNNILSQENQRRANVNGDGVINVLDSLAVSNYAIGRSNTFAVCSSAAVPGTLTVSVDATQPESKLMIGGPGDENETIAVFRFTADAVEDLELSGITFKVVNGIRVKSYKFYVGNTLVATAPSGNAPRANFSGGVVAKAGSSVKLTVKADLADIIPTSSIDTTNQDVPITVSISDVSAFGMDSANTAINRGTASANTHFAFEAYPKFGVNSASPSGNLIVSSNTLVAIFDVTAVGNEDITFDSTDVITFDVTQIVNDNDGIANTYTLKDQAGNTLDTAAVSDIRFSNAAFNFAAATFTVPAGQTKQLYVYADTREMEDDGDSIQIWLDGKSAPNDFEWEIDNDGGQYGHADIIFRGNITALALVNPNGTTAKPSLTVLSPNGGETLVEGKTYTIRWKATGVENVGIFLVQGPDPGTALWIDQVPASKGFYEWIVGKNAFPEKTNIPDEQFKILVNSVETLDKSDNYFGIAQKATDVLGRTSPCFNFGDVNGDGLVTKKDSDLILQHSVKTITLSETNQKRADLNGDGVINVLDSLAALNYAEGRTDTFTGCPSITLLFPNKGETLLAGLTYTISWESKNVEYVLLDICKAGICYTLLGTNYVGIDAALGKFNWNIDKTAGLVYVPGENLTLRIRGHSGCAVTADPSAAQTCPSYKNLVSDESDKVLSIITSLSTEDIENQLASVSQDADKLLSQI